MLVFNSTWLVIDQYHCMQNARYVSLHNVIPKSSLSTSFSIACTSVSETIGLSGWSKIDYMKLISKLSSRIYSSIKWYKRINYIV